MSTYQLNILFAAGEIGLLLLIIMFAVTARWLSKRETEREIAALPVYRPKLDGVEGPATRENAEIAALQIEFVSLPTMRQPVGAASVKKREETVEV
jgi:hypothetical protein